MHELQFFSTTDCSEMIQSRNYKETNETNKY